MNFEQFFQTHKKDLPRLELEVLLMYLLKISKTDIFMQPELELTPPQLQQLNALITRRLQNEPIAYITQNKEFFGLNFYVNQHVLIPRPETETMVEKAILLLKSGPTHQSVLDLGTGSAAIACAIAATFPQAEVLAIDKSEKALEVASRNAKELGLKNVIVKQSDWLKEIPDQSKFDLIITNPPYVKELDGEFMAEETKVFEPEEALYAGKDGLDDYRKIFEQIRRKEVEAKFIMGEFGFNQKEEIENLLEKDFSCKYTLYKDLAGIFRFFVIQTI